MRKYITALVVGAASVIIYMSLDNSQTPNMVATCPVRVSRQCIDQARDAGINVKKYDRARFPVVRTASTLADGGSQIQFTLPKMSGSVRECLQVIDWNDCKIDTAATYPAVMSRQGTAVPFTLSGVQKKCVRQKADAGLMCRRSLPDGGSIDFGNRNVYPRTQAVNPANCEPCECSVFLGDNDEDL